ncbi:MAG TPA: DUF4013 domain-containing protein [Methanospirillum sp.]|nr:DUF4013 domain-containing protein [Methanospirillum sp.]
MGVGDYLSNSFNYAQEALIGKWMRWVILIISSIIFPLIMGYTLRVMKGITPAPEPDEYGGMFIDGIKMMIIEIVYMIIPIVLAVIIFSMTGGLSTLTMLGMGVTSPVAILSMLTGSAGLGIIVFMVFVFLFSLFGIIGMVRFARSGEMGEAFAFNGILEQIGKIGWVEYIVALIVLGVVLGILYTIISMIPVIGGLIQFILTPFFAIFAARYYSLLYDERA